MKKNILIVAMLLSLTSCDLMHIHKMSVEQGNVFSSEMVSRLHPGMSEARVREIMGTPLLTNTFTDGRIDYIYTFKPGYGDMKEKFVSMTFRNGSLSTIRTNVNEGPLVDGKR